MITRILELMKILFAKNAQGISKIYHELLLLGKLLRLSLRLKIRILIIIIYIILLLKIEMKNKMCLIKMMKKIIFILMILLYLIINLEKQY